jgi:hypothetical protein
LFLGSATALAALLGATTASALGPVGVEVGARVGGGTSTASSGPNPLGFGLGGRAGASIFNVYAGVSFMYYLGGSESTPPSVIAAGGTGGTLSAKAILYGVDIGYNISAVFLTVRPQLGIGNFVLNGKIDGISTSGHNLYLEPGVTALIPLGIWFAGADLNLLVLPGAAESKAGFTADGQVGLNF